MLRRLLAVVLLAITILIATPQPSYAFPIIQRQSSPERHHVRAPQSSSNFIGRCWQGESQNATEEVACDSIKGGLVAIGSAGVAVGTCYAVDAVATAVFPPAAVFAPVCNAVGFAGGSASTVKQGIKALAY